MSTRRRCLQTEKTVCAECAATAFVGKKDCSEGCIFCNQAQWDARALFVCVLHITTVNCNGESKLRHVALPELFRNWRVAIESAARHAVSVSLPGRFDDSALPRLEAALRANTDVECSRADSDERMAARVVSSGAISGIECRAFVSIKCTVVFSIA